MLVGADDRQWCGSWSNGLVKSAALTENVTLTRYGQVQYRSSSFLASARDLVILATSVLTLSSLEGSRLATLISQIMFTLHLTYSVIMDVLAEYCQDSCEHIRLL